MRSDAAEDDQCAPVWDRLAAAAFRSAYRPCATADFSEAESAIQRGLAVVTDADTRRSLTMTLGRVRAAEGRWDEAESSFHAAAALGAGTDVDGALADLALRKAPSAALLAVVNAEVAGQRIDEADATALSPTERRWAFAALRARHGRQTNDPTRDTFFFCDPTPVAAHPAINPDYVDHGAALVGIDAENESVLRATRRGAAPAEPSAVTASTAPSPVELTPPGVAPPQSDEVPTGPDEGGDQAPPVLGEDDTTPPPADDIDQTAFREPLATYGDWVSLSDGSSAWRPNPGDVGSDFQPYVTNGQWEPTDAGWIFASSYSWGWACFHYGQWWYEAPLGWVWVPGRTWAPAWVEWRYGNDSVGWRPIPPRGRSFPTLVSRRSVWSFVHVGDLATTRVATRLVPAAEVPALLTASKAAPVRRRGPDTYSPGPPARLFLSAAVPVHPVPIRSVAQALPPPAMLAAASIRPVAPDAVEKEQPAPAPERTTAPVAEERRAEARQEAEPEEERPQEQLTRREEAVAERTRAREEKAEARRNSEHLGFADHGHRGTPPAQAEAAPEHLTAERAVARPAAMPGALRKR
jgi:hypothetical protein